VTELERLRVSGSAEERALIAGAQEPLVPIELRRQVRRALEERLSAGGRRRALRRWLLVLAGTLVAGSALAYQAVQLRSRPVVAPAPPVVPVVAPATQAAPPSPPENLVRPAARVRPAVPVTASSRVAVRSPHVEPHAWPFGAPALRAPGDLRWDSDPDEADDGAAGAPPPPPPRLLVTRGGRPEITLVLAGGRIVGRVRGAPVALELTAAQIAGHVGDRNISIWLHGREAQGSIGGVPIKFELRETRDGYHLREGYALPSALPAVATRVATTDRSVTWFPGCGAPLAAAEPGAYQGRCASGSRARLEIPEGWQRLPVLARLVLLSLFLN
jgi:hypothetical protein